MTVTIEVANHAGGVGSVKRVFFRSDDYDCPEALETAAVRFIREARAANEEALQNYCQEQGDGQEIGNPGCGLAGEQAVP